MYQVELSPKDIDYIINILVPNCHNKESLKRCLKEDPPFRKQLLADEKLFHSVMQNPAIILKEISPVLFFEILLRKAEKEMEKKIYTVEKTLSQKIPVLTLKKS